MKKNFKKYLIFFAIIFVLSFSIFGYTKSSHACAPIDPNNPNGTYCLLAPIPGLTSSTDGSIDVTNGFGDYANRIIRIFIGLLGVFAVMMIVFGGIQYMISSSGGEKNAGKDRMTNAVFGLILALSSYMILNTINPNLVKLNISVPSGELTLYQDEGDQNQAVEDYSNSINPAPGLPTTRLCSDFDSCKALCLSSKKSDGTYTYSGTSPGVMDPASAQSLSGIPLVEGGCRNCMASPAVVNALKLIKPAVDSLILSSKIPNRNYTFTITSAYRPIADQIRVMCTNSGKGNSDAAMTEGINHVVGSPRTIAYPGTSNHGVGTAVDIAFKFNGQRVYNCSSGANANGVRDKEDSIEKILDRAGFQRLNVEGWHFQLNGDSSTCKYPGCGEPTKCSP